MHKVPQRLMLAIVAHGHIGKTGRSAHFAVFGLDHTRKPTVCAIIVEALSISEVNRP